MADVYVPKEQTDKGFKLVAIDMRSGITYIGFTDADIDETGPSLTKLNDYIVIPTTSLIRSGTDYQKLAVEYHRQRQISGQVNISNNLEIRVAIHELEQ